MDFTEEHKNRVSKELALRLAQAIKKGEIHSVDLPIVAEFILDNLSKIRTQEELIAFLKQLAKERMFFADILEIELGKEIEKHEKEKIDEILHLIKANKIDEAIQKADSLTETNKV